MGLGNQETESQGRFPYRGGPRDRRVSDMIQEQDAHARLIASASDMLAALREIARLRLANGEGNLRQRMDRMWETAGAAIAKATGNKPGI